MQTWELIDSQTDSETHRMRVDGGWIYRHQHVCIDMKQPPATMVFVPDISDQANLMRKHISDPLANLMRKIGYQ